MIVLYQENGRYHKCTLSYAWCNYKIGAQLERVAYFISGHFKNSLVSHSLIDCPDNTSRYCYKGEVVEKNPKLQYFTVIKSQYTTNMKERAFSAFRQGKFSRFEWVSRYPLCSYGAPESIYLRAILPNDTPYKYTYNGAYTQLGCFYDGNARLGYGKAYMQIYPITGISVVVKLTRISDSCRFSLDLSTVDCCLISTLPDSDNNKFSYNSSMLSLNKINNII